jgi:hypothetical protein
LRNQELMKSTETWSTMFRCQWRFSRGRYCIAMAAFTHGWLNERTRDVHSPDRGGYRRCASSVLISFLIIIRLNAKSATVLMIR